MTKQTYRIRRRHDGYSAGDIVELTDAEAAALDNVAPGLLEHVEQAAPPKNELKPVKPAKGDT